MSWPVNVLWDPWMCCEIRKEACRSFCFCTSSGTVSLSRRITRGWESLCFRSSRLPIFLPCQAYYFNAPEDCRGAAKWGCQYRWKTPISCYWNPLLIHVNVVDMVLLEGTSCVWSLEESRRQVETVNLWFKIPFYIFHLERYPWFQRRDFGGWNPVLLWWFNSSPHIFLVFIFLLETQWF